MKYEFLLFDLDNTLWDFDFSEKIALSEFFIMKGLKEDKLDEHIKDYKIINKKLWEKLEKSEITREELLKSRFYEFFKTLNININGKEYSDDYEKIIGSHGEIIEGAYELLEDLKERGYKIFAVTNGIYNIQKMRLKNSVITNFFENVFISEEIGFVKPDIRYFEYIQNNIKNFNKCKSILIGDSLNADIAGANNYGIDSIWYNRNQSKNTSNYTPTHIVNKYSEIINLLS